MKEQRELVENIRSSAKKIVQASKASTSGEIDDIKNDVRNEIGRLVFKKTNRRPMILPVVILA